MTGLLLAAWLAGCAHHPVSLAGEPPTHPCCTGVPEGKPGRVLESGAASLDLPTRIRALHALVVLDATPGAGAWGRRGRYDPDPFVQQWVARGLARRAGDAAAVGLLRDLALAGNVDGVTRGIAAGAALGLDPDARWLLDALLPLPDGWATAGLLAAAARTGDPAVLRRLNTLLATGEVPLEVGFWDLLAASGRAELREGVLAALPRLDPDLEVVATTTLLAIAPDAGGDRVGPLLHGDVERALEVVERVRLLPGPAATAVLRAASASAAAPTDRVAALWLGLRADAPPPRLAEAVDDPDPEVRRVAAEVAGALSARGVALPTRVRAALLAALAGEDVALQGAAVDAVALGPDADRLLPLLDDESLDLRVRVAAALSLAPTAAR